MLLEQELHGQRRIENDMAKQECASGKVGHEQILTEHIFKGEEKGQKMQSEKYDKNQETKTKGERFQNKGTMSCVK